MVFAQAQYGRMCMIDHTILSATLPKDKDGNVKLPKALQDLRVSLVKVINERILNRNYLKTMSL